MKMKDLMFYSLLLIGSSLWGAIGCKSITYTPDYWDINAPGYVNCSCPCADPINEKGYCPKCGHYGRVDRGKISYGVLNSLGVSLY